MNDHQKTAWGHPCLEAEQCAHQRYRHFYRDGRRLWSIVLTVNVGMERNRRPFQTGGWVLATRRFHPLVFPHEGLLPTR